MHPVPAEVMACLYFLSATSPAAKTHGIELQVLYLSFPSLNFFSFSGSKVTFPDTTFSQRLS